MTLFRLSWKNLTHKPLSMLLSLVLFALGVGLISLVLILNRQLDQQFERNMKDIDMVIGAKGSPLQLVLSSIFHLDAPTGNIQIGEARAFLRPGHPLIARAIPLSLGDSYGGYRIVGTTHDLVEHYGAQVAEGRLWEKTMEVTVGANAARKLGLRPGDTFQSIHGLDDNEDLLHEGAGAFRVSGILRSSGTVIDQLILTGPGSVWAVHGEHGEPAAHGHAEETPGLPLHEMVDEDITAILVKFKARNVQTLNMPRGINENTNLLAANPSYEISKLFNQLGQAERILRILGLVIVVVSSFSIFISLYNSLQERRYELAIMRTLGASRGKLFLLITIEGLLLAILGYSLGIMLSHLGLEAGARLAADSYRYPFSGWTFLPQEAWLLGGAVAIGFLAALIPAIQARNTDIHRTLAET
jgi:putative ABC transport system permease protein